MTVGNTSVVRIEGTLAHMGKFLKDVSNRASKVVRGSSGVVYVELPSSELGWLDKVAKDTNVKKLEIPHLPTYKTAPCGILTTALYSHVPRCKKCAALRPPKPHDGEAATVVKVEGLEDLTLWGMIDFMKKRMDEALLLAQEYENVIKAVENIPELESQIKRLQEQLGNHKQAVKYFTERG